MTINASDFANWKSDPVTKAFLEACYLRIQDAKNTLAASAGLNSTEDNFNRGFIHAYSEVFDFRIDDLEGVDGN
jgi:hypothetical protein